MAAEELPSKEDVHRAANEIFSEEQLPWRMVDGCRCFVQIDENFLTADAAQRAHEILEEESLEGVLEEFSEARKHLACGRHRLSIEYACHSVESTLKAITGTTGNASVLIREAVNQGIFDNLPDNVPKVIGEQVLMSLPAIGNRLGRHGQGEIKVEVPREYAQLALDLAGAFILILVRRHMDREPAEEATPEEEFAGISDDDIPF